MHFYRDLSDRVQRLAAQFPALVLTGARQSGKTTLLRAAFPDHTYVSLDLPSTAELAENDPAQFLSRYPKPVVIDEVQYAPRLFRHLKAAIDADRRSNGQFVLTGSQKFTLMQEVGDSLAGRCGWAELETLSCHELRRAGSVGIDAEQVSHVLARGLFPALWQDPGIDAAEFYRGYLATYIERDVRQLLNITSLRDFERFIRLCATYTGQLVNKTDLARGVGVAAKTIHQWLSVLEASNQVVLIEPYFANVGKRLAKTPKLYFCDPGLAAFLLGLDPVTLPRSPFTGALWETFVYSELRKHIQAAAPQATLYFYRDQEGREVDFLLLSGGNVTLVECKWTELPSDGDARRMSEVASLLQGAKPVGIPTANCYVVARPPNAFPLNPSTQAIHGFLLHEALSSKGRTAHR
jgi:predicted AAA+ superfamily ATPase